MAMNAQMGNLHLLTQTLAAIGFFSLSSPKRKKNGTELHYCKIYQICHMSAAVRLTEHRMWFSLVYHHHTISEFLDLEEC